jgi:NADH:ubiquinone oxidoreductase subunit H
MLSIFNYLTTSNILDFGYDLFYYVKETYPYLATLIDNSLYVLHMGIGYTYYYMHEVITTIFIMKYINSAIFNVGIKFLVLIALLVFVRGGIPRYRFDFLTKIGWIKFLSLVLSIFLSSMLLIFLI